MDRAPSPTPFAVVATAPLPQRVLNLWRAGALGVAAVVLAAGVAVGLLSGRPEVSAAAVGVAAVVGAVGAVVTRRHFVAWRWGVDDRWIEVRHGVLWRTTQIVPRSRVQTVTTRTGPLDRWLGLVTVVVHTAGTHTPNLRIPHLDASTAARLEHELAR